MKKTTLAIILSSLVNLQLAPWANASSVVFSNDFDNGASGWSGSESLNVSHTNNLGVDGGGALYGYFNQGYIPLPLVGSFEVSTNTSSTFPSDFTVVDAMRFSALFENRAPSYMYIAIQGRGQTAIAQFDLSDLSSGVWHTFTMPFNASFWDHETNITFASILSGMEKLEIVVGVAGFGKQAYRIDNFQLLQGVTNSGTGGSSGGTGGSTTTNGTSTSTNTVGNTGGSTSTNGTSISTNTVGNTGGTTSTNGTSTSTNTVGNTGGTTSTNGVTISTNTVGNTGGTSTNGSSGGTSGGSLTNQSGSVTNNTGNQAITNFVPVGALAQDNLRPSFRWPAITTATWYQVRILRYGELSQKEWVEGTNTWRPLANLTFGEYEWQVQGWSQQVGFMAWSTLTKFSVPSPGNLGVRPLTPTTEQTAPDVVYRWSAVMEAGWYNLQVERVGFGVWHDKWYVNDSPFECRGLVTEHPSGTYRWRVRSWKDGSMGPWSDLITFTVQHQKDLRYFQPSSYTNNNGSVITMPYSPAYR